MKLRALTLSLLLLLAPHFAAGAGAGAGAGPAPAAKAPLLSGACAKFYAELSGVPLPGNLAFLPKRLREEVAAVGELLRWDQRVGGHHSFAYHPELKRLVDELQRERRLHVQNAVALRSQRRALRDGLLLARARARATPEQMREGLKRLGRIDRQLEKNSDELEALMRTLEPLREALGMGAIAEGAHRTARELNAVVVLHDVQPAAAGQLAHKGVGKGMRFKFNSTDEGVIAGLVPYDQALSAKIRAQGPEVVAKKQAEVEAALDHGLVRKRKHRVGSLVAVKKNGTVKFVDEDLVPINERDIAWVLEEMGPDPEGSRLIISDVDPAAFGFARTRASGPRPGLAAGAQPKLHPTMGVITEQEREVVVTFNHRVEELLGHENDRLRYMTHGAENRNPHSQGPTGYPMAAFLPSGERRLIQRGPAEDPHAHYRAFVREMFEAGYEIPVNPRWGWAQGPAAPRN